MLHKRITGSDGVMGVYSGSESYQSATYLNKELFWMHGPSYPIKEPSFSQKLNYGSPGIVSQRVPVSQLYSTHKFITICCSTAHIRSMCSMDGQSLATVLASCRLSSGQDMGLCGLCVANSNSCYYIITSSTLVRWWNFLGGLSVGFRRCRYLPCIDTSHLGLNLM